MEFPGRFRRVGLLLTVFLSIHVFGMGSARAAEGAREAEASLTITNASQQSAPVDWITVIETDRESAYEELTSGNLLGGSTALVQSLHNLPVDQPALMDDAYGSVQLLLYAMEYLMDEPARLQFVENSLDPDEDPIDRFIVSAYNIYIGQESAAKTAATRELLAASVSENPFARIGSLFILSDPYFFDNADFTHQSQGILSTEFPNLAITLESYRYTVYGARKSGGAVLTKAADAFTGESGRSARFATDAVIAATINSTRSVGEKLKQDPIDSYASAFEANADWKVRFGLLLMLEPHDKGSGQHRVAQICESVANSTPDSGNVTPDVVRARLMLLKIARRSWDASPGNPQTGPEGFHWVESLLDTKWKKNPFERCLYEDVMKGVRSSAKHLAAIGRPEIAARIFDRLGKQYPNSLVSSECDTEIALMSAEPDVEQQ